MAFGFKPSYSSILTIGNLTREQVFIVAYETALNLNWEITFLGDDGLMAFIGKELFAWKAEFKLVYDNGNVQIKSSSIGSEIIDWGRNKKNIDEFVYVFNKLKSSITVEDPVEKYNSLKTGFLKNNSESSDQPTISLSETTPGFLRIFVPGKGYTITALLLDLNIVIFIIMCISGVNILQPDSESLLKWGANFRPVTLDGQWWRLVTSSFLHIGVIHLLMNMYALLYIGLLLEPRLGTSKFLLAYLLTALSASTASVLWHPITVSAGASGAIFGLYGVFLAMLTTDLIERTIRRALLTSILIFVSFNLLNGLKGGIDNAAHLGGFIGGLIIGYSYISSLREPDDPELHHKAVIYLSAGFLALSLFTITRIPNDIPKYEEKIKNFPVFESMALESLHNNTVEIDSVGRPIPFSKEKILKAIKERGIYYWNENIKLLKDIEKLKLPEPIIDRNKILLQYCELRIKSFELIYKSIEDSTTMYEPQIENYTKQIEQIVISFEKNNR